MNTPKGTGLTHYLSQYKRRTGRTPRSMDELFDFSKEVKQEDYIREEQAKMIKE